MRERQLLNPIESKTIFFLFNIEVCIQVTYKCVDDTAAI